MNSYDVADLYSLGRLESLIGVTYDEETRRAYIKNWLARAETIANSPRLDAAAWRKRLEWNLWRWGMETTTTD
jgi:hypothetical protein